MALPENYETLSLGELIALSAELRDLASALSKEEQHLREEKKEVDACILSHLEAMGVESTSANGFTVTRSKDEIASVNDWAALHAFISEQKAPYLLQRRVTQDAVKEMIALHGEVPGVTLIPSVTLSLRKK